jgi:hypothetical protein
MRHISGKYKDILTIVDERKASEPPCIGRMVDVNV